MGFSLKQMFTPPKSIRKFQPKKLGNVSWWKDFGGQVVVPAALAATGLGAAGIGPLSGVMSGAIGGVSSAVKGAGIGAKVAGAYSKIGPIGQTLLKEGGKMAVKSAIGGIAGGGGGGGGGGNREKTYRDSFDASIEDERGRGSRFSDEYEQRALAYDPQESINQSVRGTAAIEMPRLAASQVGTGRLRSGFGYREQDEYMSNLMMSNAMNAEEYKFRNMEDIGGYGERSRDRTMDADFGRYSTERMAREQERASRRGMWGSLGGAAISAAGTIIASR